MDAWPFLGRQDEAFFAAVRQEVKKARHLGRGLVAHQDRVITAGPDLVSPFVEPSDLSRQPGVDETLEVRELFGIPRGAKQMVVV